MFVPTIQTLKGSYITDNRLQDKYDIFEQNRISLHPIEPS